MTRSKRYKLANLFKTNENVIFESHDQLDTCCDLFGPFLPSAVTINQKITSQMKNW